MSERADMAEPRPDELPVDEKAVEQAESRHDEDDRLRPDFVSAVLDAVEDDDRDRARELVSPLHPADIADLLELTPSDRRGEVAAALGDLVGAEVLSELNDYVRDDLLDALEPQQVADFAAELDTDDASRSSRIWRRPISRPSSMRWSRKIARRSKARWPIRRSPPVV